MSITIDGLNDLFTTLENLGDVGKKVGRKSIKNGLEIVLDQLKNDAPVDEEKSREKLDIQHIRSNKDGSAWGACGIGANNWEQTKQLWFQNYGYDNYGLNYKGQMHISKNVGWIDKSFAKCEKQANKAMIDMLSTEIDKVLR